MKTLAKLFVVSACVVGMTSCLKNSDPDFGISQGGWYILQKNEVIGDDTVSKFAPYIWFATNEIMAQASVTCQSYPLGVPGKLTNYIWMSKVPDYDYKTELEEQSYTFTGTNAEGEKVIYTVQMGVDPDKAIGDFNAEFSYASGKGLTVKWGEVENAGYFELVCWLSDDPENVKTLATTSQKEISFTNYDASSAGLTNGKKYGFEVFAYTVENNRLTVKLENRYRQNEFYVESWGTDNPAD